MTFSNTLKEMRITSHLYEKKWLFITIWGGETFFGRVQWRNALSCACRIQSFLIDLRGRDTCAYNRGEVPAAYARKERKSSAIRGGKSTPHMRENPTLRPGKRGEESALQSLAVVKREGPRPEEKKPVASSFRKKREKKRTLASLREKRITSFLLAGKKLCPCLERRGPVLRSLNRKSITGNPWGKE